MADNSTQSGADTIATDDVTTLNGGASSGVKVQRVKVGYGDDATYRDASTAFPLPTTLVSSGGLATTAGSITASATNTPGTPVTASTTAQVVASTSLAGNATFHIVTVAFVGTLIFEGSVDAGLNYSPLIAIREDGTGSESSTAINTGAAFIRQYTVALPGLAYFRVRCSAFTSGSVAVLIAPGPTLIEPSPSLAASSATIGNVGGVGVAGTPSGGVVTVQGVASGTAQAVTVSAGTAVMGTALPQPATLLVTGTAVISTGVTVTLPAVASQFHYITSIRIVRYAAAALTGAATPVLVTSTNLPGSPVWSIDTVGAIGTSMTTLDNFSGNPLKSSTVNTATTIVAPIYTSAIWRIQVTYYTST